jgi:hypothetical protein
VVTKATLADAFAIALKRLGLAVTRQQVSPRRREREMDETDPRQATELTED